MLASSSRNEVSSRTMAVVIFCNVAKFDGLCCRELVTVIVTMGPNMDAFSSPHRSIVILVRENSLTVLSSIGNDHVEVLLADSAPSRFFKRLAQGRSVAVHDGAKHYRHHDAGIVERMNARRVHE